MMRASSPGLPDPSPAVHTRPHKPGRKFCFFVYVRVAHVEPGSPARAVMPPLAGPVEKQGAGLLFM